MTVGGDAGEMTPFGARLRTILDVIVMGAASHAGTPCAGRQPRKVVHSGTGSSGIKIPSPANASRSGVRDRFLLLAANAFDNLLVSYMVAMDLTRQLFRFCEIRRHLWNTQFAGHIESISDPRVDAFLQIQKLLFKAIVLESCGKEQHDLGGFGTRPFEFLRVEISREIDQLEILVSRSRHPSQWIKQLIKREDWTQKNLFFVDFFDWYPQDPSGRCSYPFIEVEAKAKSSAGNGERWLIPNEYVTVALSQT